MGLLPRRPQERFRTGPGLYRLVCMEQVCLLMHKPYKVCGVEIPLHPEATLLAVVHSQRKRFLLYPPTLTGLRQLSGTG